MLNIIEELDSKAQTYQDIFTTRFQKQTGVDLTNKPQRDARALIANAPLIKTWFIDVAKIQASNSTDVTRLVVEYFKKSEQFSYILSQWIANEATEGDVNAVQKFINIVAMAIAYEKAQQSIVAYLFALTPNSD